MLGIDFTDTYCQISWLFNKKARFGRGFVNAATGGVSREPVTFSGEKGQEAYDIPVVLFKEKGAPAWTAGQEAVKAARETDGVLVDHLLEKARRDE